nr:hypothetical protein GCM10017745_41380 [Saccharothrix mutabilis subsp. capreolus]
MSLDTPAERTLAVQLVRLPAAVAVTAAEYAPHKLCTYLYETAVAFSAFYEHCPILKAPDDRTRTRGWRWRTSLPAC